MAAPINDIYANAGLDTVTKEEYEDITSTLSALANPDSADATEVLANGPTPTGGEGSSPDNVYYINFNPSTKPLSDDEIKALKNVQDNIGLTLGFFSTKAQAATKDKVAEGKLKKDDPTGQANYTAKVINSLVVNAPWIPTVGIQTLDKSFTVEKEKFHKTLVKNFTEGLNLPSDILGKLEGFLTNIQNVLKTASASKDVRQYYVLITAYTKDDALKTFRPFLRTIYFTPSQSLTEHTKKSKNDRSYTDVNIAFKYVQFDGAFNNNLFEDSAKQVLAPNLTAAGKTYVDPNRKVDVDV